MAAIGGTGRGSYGDQVGGTALLSVHGSFHRSNFKRSVRNSPIVNLQTGSQNEKTTGQIKPDQTLTIHWHFEEKNMGSDTQSCSIWSSKVFCASSIFHQKKPASPAKHCNRGAHGTHLRSSGGTKSTWSPWCWDGSGSSFPPQ